MQPDPQIDRPCPPATEEPAIVFYWRPGCGFCGALDRQLRSAGLDVEKRNIWEDETAAAFVRSVARGNETVPTVVVNGTAMVNPSLSDIVDRLAKA